MKKTLKSKFFTLILILIMTLSMSVVVQAAPFVDTATTASAQTSYTLNHLQQTILAQGIPFHMYITQLPVRPIS